MNDRQLENKVRQDAARVKKDLNTLVGDSTVQLSRFEDHVNQTTGKAKEDLVAWVENSVSQMSGELEKMTAEARDTMVDAVASVKKDVGNGLTQYNQKAQQVADKVPGGFGEKASRYPWVALTIALVSGFLLGSLLKPAQKAAWVAQI
jgi:ElaB/YqjD/DUF883 family membrane-anchored ribosome-binding protein